MTTLNGGSTWERLKLFVQRNRILASLSSRALFLLINPKYRLVKRRIPSLIVRPGTADLFVFFSVFMRGEYAQPLDGCMPDACSVIVDLGANVGYTAALFAIRYPDAAIYAIELDRDNYERLTSNTRSLPRIVCMHAGISHTGDPLRVIDPGLGHWGYRGEPAVP